MEISHEQAIQAIFASILRHMSAEEIKKLRADLRKYEGGSTLGCAVCEAGLKVGQYHWPVCDPCVKKIPADPKKDQPATGHWFGRMSEGQQ